MKKPKLKKYPKKPKSTASTTALQNYVDKCAAIDKDNAAKEKAYKADVKEREGLKKKIAGIGKA